MTMSTFQLARDLVEWSQLFSSEERGSIDFTYDDILPVAGSHRKLLLEVLENVKPQEENDSIEDLEGQLGELKMSKNKILQELRDVDALISDMEDKKIEEELRCDLFYVILDEQRNIQEFIDSFLSKVTSYYCSPPMATTLKSLSEEVSSLQQSLDEMNNSDDNDNENDEDMNSARDSVIDSYLSLMSDMKKISNGTEIEIDEIINPNESSSTTVDESMKSELRDGEDALLHESIAEMEKEMLMEFIKKEEMEIERLTGLETNNAIDRHNTSHDTDRLNRNLKSKLEQLEMKSHQNMTILKSLQEGVAEVLEILSDSPSSSNDINNVSLLQNFNRLKLQCNSIADEWRRRGELIKTLPAWKLRKVKNEEQPPKLVDQMGVSASNINTVESVGGFGLEHLMSGSKSESEVCYRDSVQKKTQDHRSEFQSVVSAAGVSNSLSLKDTFRQLRDIQGRCHEQERSKACSSSQSGSCYADKLISELKQLEANMMSVDPLWSDDNNGIGASELKLAIKKAESTIHKTRSNITTLNQGFENLSKREAALKWAIHDLRDSYTSAPNLMKVLDRVHETSSNEVLGSSRFANMSIKDIVNEFRELHDMPAIE